MGCVAARLSCRHQNSSFSAQAITRSAASHHLQLQQLSSAQLVSFRLISTLLSITTCTTTILSLISDAKDRNITKRHTKTGARRSTSYQSSWAAAFASEHQLATPKAKTAVVHKPNLFKSWLRQPSARATIGNAQLQATNEISTSLAPFQATSNVLHWFLTPFYRKTIKVRNGRTFI